MTIKARIVVVQRRRRMAVTKARTAVVPVALPRSRSVVMIAAVEVGGKSV